MARSEYKVFSQGKIANLTLKNRIVRSATGEGAVTREGIFTDKMLPIYRDLAKGGAGMIVTGLIAPMPEARALNEQSCLWTEEHKKEVAKIANEVHSNSSDCKIIAQLCHGGGQKLTDNVECVGPSAYTSPVSKKHIRELSENEIREIIDAFINAAVMTKEAGFDGCQLHAAHGWLLSAFLSPYTNHRTDYFGGSVKNRVNIIKDIVAGIKEKIVGFPILIKINCDDSVVGGIDIDNFHELAKEIERTGVDAIEISGGTWDCLVRTEEELGFFPIPIPEAHIRINSPEKQSYFARYTEQLDISIPIILIGGHRNIDRMEEIVNQGKVDFVSMCRPFICEPDLPNRWLKGKGSANAECISCNLCIFAAKSGGVACTYKVKNLKGKEIEEMQKILGGLFD
jgi:2,4-dienoyl-CoA reductase-like NADH-dependent reductase (Old Yellow Enzyme family)